MSTTFDSIDGATSRALVGGVESFRFNSAGPNKVAPGVITLAMLTTGAMPLGVGQTWQAVTRTKNVNYTNSTGRPIGIAYSIQTNGTHQLNIDGIFVINNTDVSGVGITGFSVIPAGSVYYTAGSGLESWFELR